LVPIPDQGDPSVVFVGDDQQRAGGVLIEHAGLVDEQHVDRAEHSVGARTGVGDTGIRVDVTDPKSDPRAALVPAEAVLVGQPCRR
jgi:hypothetical protein